MDEVELIVLETEDTIDVVESDEPVEAETEESEAEDVVMYELLVLTEVDKELEEVVGGVLADEDELATTTLAAAMAWRTDESTQEVEGVE